MENKNRYKIVTTNMIKRGTIFTNIERGKKANDGKGSRGRIVVATGQ